MQKTKESTSSASYAVRFGGVWLEYHERIEFAERELSTAKYLCDEVTVERDLLLSEKMVLEKKFKESIASLTQTETNHLEAKQIMDQVRDEQKDLSRRCLAAEAHTEWLEDQVKQLKVSRSIKDEEISSLQFRIENLKSSVADGDAAKDVLKRTVTERDVQITNLQNLLKSRDEEILVQSRSLHSKDRQMAQLVRERDAFKDDLTDTQRALALARRTSAVSRKCTTVVSGSNGVLKSSSNVTCTASAVKEANKSHVSTHTSSPAHTASATNSNAATVLRKYKSSLQGRNGAESAMDSNSVLLEDILLSVLTPEPVCTTTTSNHTDSTDADNSVDMTMDVVTDSAFVNTNTTQNIMTAPLIGAIDASTHVLSTPLAGRKSPVTLSDAPTAALHLDELDLDYINNILDTPTPMDTVGREDRPCAQDVGAGDHSVHAVRTACTVQKTLFGASPVPARSASAGRVSASHSKGGSRSAVNANPWAVQKTATPSSRSGVVSVVGSATQEIDSADIHAYQEREHNYKSALYLLQEEVRLLRAQVAGFEAAKRTVRGTPKKTAKCTAGPHNISTSDAGSVCSNAQSYHNNVRSSAMNSDIQCMKRDSMCRYNQHGSTFKGKVLFA